MGKDFHASGASVGVGGREPETSFVGDGTTVGVELAATTSGTRVLVADTGTTGTVGTPPHFGVSQALNAISGNDNNRKNKHRFINGMSVVRWWAQDG